MDDRSIQLLARYRDGDEEAAEQIFERYVHRLVGLARNHISDRLGTRVDPEDVVQSVYRSFYRRASDGQFTLGTSGDLWKLLAMITVNKVRKQANFHQRQKRDTRREQNASGSPTQTDREVEIFVEEPNTEEALAAMDELNIVMESLDEQQRAILELRLSGYELSQIAQQIRRSERTVRRALDTAYHLLEERFSG